MEDGGIQVEEQAARALANECGQVWTPEWAHQKQEMQVAALPGIQGNNHMLIVILRIDLES